MDLNAKWVEKIKQSVAADNCAVLDWLLRKRKNHHFYKDKRKKTAITKFAFDPTLLEWSNDSIVDPFVNLDGDNFIEVLLDVRAVGTLNQFNRTTGAQFVNEPISFDFTIRAYVQDDGYLSNDNIHLLSSEQKALVNYHKQYEKELKRIEIITIPESTYQGMEAFNFFTRIWKNVDNLDEDMVNSTNLHYFNELTETHRNIMYGVSCANMWGRYISHHSDNSYKFQGKTVYPLNQTFYDNRHMFYLETAMEEIYTFYERIAHLLYIFLKPGIFETNALSFNKLFETQTQKVLEVKFTGLTENEHYHWFLSRMKKEHQTLSGYRHPLIHYRSSNTFLKGSYTNSKSRIWLENAMDGADELIRLEKNMEKILAFVSQEMHVCHEAFEQAVLLCESLELSCIEEDSAENSNPVPVPEQPGIFCGEKAIKPIFDHMIPQQFAFPDLAVIIINELTNIQISLTSPLLKTKVLAYRIQNQELLDWCNHELTGYPIINQVPDYRRTTGDIYADYIKGNLMVKDQFVALKGGPELFEICMRQGIQTLETYTSSYVGETFEGEQRQIIVDHLTSQNRNLQISRIYKKTPANIVLDVLSTVRNRLLDFMLEMERTYDHVSEIKELKVFNPAITQIVHNNITNFGDGGIINTGLESKIDASISIEKSN